MVVNERTATEERAVASEESKSKQSAKLRSLITYIGVALVMLVAGYFAGAKLSHPSGAEPTPASNNDKPSKESEKAHQNSGEIVMMENVIVNPSGTGGTRFLSVSIGFEVGSPATAKMLEEREAVIKDALITILGSKTISQLSDPKEREIARFQIKKRVEQLLQSEDLMAVYFTDFILQ
jgi:flagellar FliL protein